MLQLVSCGYHTIHNEGIIRNRPQGSGNYTFVFFKSKTEIGIHEERFEVEGHTFILFAPNTPHYYQELERPFINDWFHCNGAGLAQLLNRLQFPIDTPVRVADQNLISRIIMELQTTLRYAGSLQEQIIDLDLRSTFMKLIDLQQRTVPEKLHRYYSSFTELRNELYRTPYHQASVLELATSLNLSKSYFQHMYKELFGCSVMQDIINARLEHAKYLLEHSESSINQISNSCGYENDTHFMRQFKKFVGVTPKQYRQNMLNTIH